MNTLKRILSPLASLRITVTLLLCGMLLIYAGTLAQRSQGIWDIQHQYFHSLMVWIPFQNLVPFYQGEIPGSFPFVGGYTLVVLLLVNLLAAHGVKFKYNSKRIGVILIHSALIMLLLGEVGTSLWQVESQMPIAQRESTNWSQDIRTTELAVTDTSPADHNNVVTIPGKWLGQRKEISDARLPFEITVVKHYQNSMIFGPMQPDAQGDTLANAGEWQKVKIAERPVIAGTQSEDVDRQSAFVKLTKGGHDLGTYLVSVVMDQPQKVTVDGKTYEVALRFKRLYKPYTITLLEFRHDKFVGSEMPRNFSSRIRLVNPKENVDREILIRMNEPLRYGGETFYQSSFMPGDSGTVLQVVRNPVWTVPYIAVLIGAIGMLIHFGLHLVSFLQRQLKTWDATEPSGRIPPAPPLASSRQPGGKKNSGKSARRTPAAVARAETYSLQPTRGWGSASVLVPAAVTGLCLLYVLGHTMPRSYNKNGMDLDTFARLPVSFDGRPMPVDSVARNSLKIISGRETLDVEGGDRIPAVQWLADVMAKNDRAREYKAIRIDHPQIKALLDLNPDESRYAIRDVMTPTNAQRLEEQYQRLPGDAKQWDLYQKKIAELHDHIELFVRFGELPALADLWDVVRDPSLAKEALQQAQAAEAAAQSPGNAGKGPTAEQAQAMERIDQWNEALGRVKWLSDPKNPGNKKFDLYFGAPLQAGQQWQGIALAIPAFQGGAPVNESIAVWCDIAKALRDGRTTDFNRIVSDYDRKVTAHPPVGGEKAGFETFFNRFDPFLICMVLYVGVFLFAVVSWLGFRRPLVRTAVAVALLSLLVHSFGLLARMYISGRPPVTSLYSAAVFIGWGSVILCLFLELLYRNGIGAAGAGILGFASLLVAGGLYLQGADQLGQLQAVLDTNFWLATHVVTITLGYATMFVAGLLGTAYVIGGMFTNSLSPDTRKTLGKMTYGIVCFAMLLSFVGTILGGIWADQSWGRFWGWDPKENGAILIVLWNAIFLHARWCGLVRERGMAVLAIFGNIVTAWSMFGTNMLGVGLHSYGFMEAALPWVKGYVMFQVLVMILGCLPLNLWRSFAAPEPATR